MSIQDANLPIGIWKNANLRLANFKANREIGGPGRLGNCCTIVT